jgi:hypothetical protein
MFFNGKKTEIFVAFRHCIVLPGMQRRRGQTWHQYMHQTYKVAENGRRGESTNNASVASLTFNIDRDMDVASANVNIGNCETILERFESL